MKGTPAIAVAGAVSVTRGDAPPAPSATAPARANRASRAAIRVIYTARVDSVPEPWAWFEPDRGMAHFRYATATAGLGRFRRTGTAGTRTGGRGGHARDEADDHDAAGGWRLAAHLHADLQPGDRAGPASAGRCGRSTPVVPSPSPARSCTGRACRGGSRTATTSWPRDARRSPATGSAGRCARSWRSAAASSSSCRSACSSASSPGPTESRRGPARAGPLRATCVPLRARRAAGTGSC